MSLCTEQDRSVLIFVTIFLIISFQCPAQSICPAVQARTQLQKGVYVLVGSGSSCLGQIWTQLLISICPCRLSPRSSFSTRIYPGSRSVPSSCRYTNNIIIEQLSHTSLTPKSVYIYCALWLRTLTLNILHLLLFLLIWFIAYFFLFKLHLSALEVEINHTIDQI